MNKYFFLLTWMFFALHGSEPENATNRYLDNLDRMFPVDSTRVYQESKIFRAIKAYWNYSQCCPLETPLIARAEFQKYFAEYDGELSENEYHLLLEYKMDTLEEEGDRAITLIDGALNRFKEESQKKLALRILFMTATRKSNIPLMDHLITHHAAPVNFTEGMVYRPGYLMSTPVKRSPLHEAAVLRSKKTIEFLFQHQADPSILDSANNNALVAIDEELRSLQQEINTYGYNGLIGETQQSYHEIKGIIRKQQEKPHMPIEQNHPAADEHDWEKL